VQPLPMHKLGGVAEVVREPVGSRERFLHVTYPDVAPLGETLALLVRVLARAEPPLKTSVPLEVPSGQVELLLMVDAPGLRLLSEPHQKLRLPVDGDSDPVLFQLLPLSVGRRRISIRAWSDGRFVGSLAVEIRVISGAPHAAPMRTSMLALSRGGRAMNQLIALPWSSEPLSDAVQESGIDAGGLAESGGDVVGRALVRALQDPAVGSIVSQCFLPRIYRPKFDEVREGAPITQEALPWWFQPFSLSNPDLAVLVPDDGTEGNYIGLFRRIAAGDVTFLMPTMITFSSDWTGPFTVKLHAGACGLEDSESPGCAGSCSDNWVCGPCRSPEYPGGPLVEGCRCMHPDDVS
jgi:hypothetical protein